MNDARLFRKDNKTLVVLIDHNRPENIKVWYNIEVNQEPIESGFMSIEQYKTKVDKENWIQSPKDNYRLMV